MTREDIIRMAREAGFTDASFCRWSAYTDDLKRFAALVADAEREACAKVCEAMRPSKEEFDERYYAGCTDSAAAIRARETK